MDLAPLHARIGQLALENDFLEPALWNLRSGTCAHHGGIAERKAMIDRDHALPTTRQAQWLGISRGAVKSLARPELPTASVAASQAPTAAVDNSAPSAIRPQST